MLLDVNYACPRVIFLVPGCCMLIISWIYITELLPNNEWVDGEMISSNQNFRILDSTLVPNRWPHRTFLASCTVGGASSATCTSWEDWPQMGGFWKPSPFHASESSWICLYFLITSWLISGKVREKQSQSRIQIVIVSLASLKYWKILKTYLPKLTSNGLIQPSIGGNYLCSIKNHLSGWMLSAGGGGPTRAKQLLCWWLTHWKNGINQPGFYPRLRVIQSSPIFWLFLQADGTAKFVTTCSTDIIYIPVYIYI